MNDVQQFNYKKAEFEKYRNDELSKIKAEKKKLMTSNATYIATFEAIPSTQYTITVMSNNDDWGTVTGDGTYDEGATATLTATPATGYHFVSWNDGDTNNPRQVTVMGDATYIATFAANVGIDDVEGTTLALTPNPATDMVTVSGVKAGSNVTLLDVTGHAVFTQAIKQSDNQAITIDVSMLPSGVYFVRVSNGAVTVVRKLIVK